MGNFAGSSRRRNTTATSDRPKGRSSSLYTDAIRHSASMRCGSSVGMPAMRFSQNRTERAVIEVIWDEMLSRVRAGKHCDWSGCWPETQVIISPVRPRHLSVPTHLCLDPRRANHKLDYSTSTCGKRPSRALEELHQVADTRTELQSLLRKDSACG